MDIFTLVWGFFVGVILPVQAGTNGRLFRAGVHPAYVAAWSFASAAIVMLAISALVRYGSMFQTMATRVTPDLSRVPWWAWLGGVMGAFYVTSSAMLVPRVGAVMVTVLLVAGQVVAALTMDSFGLFGAIERPLSAMRIGGVVVVAVGVAMVFKGTAGHWPWMPRV